MQHRVHVLSLCMRHPQFTAALVFALSGLGMPRGAAAQVDLLHAVGTELAVSSAHRGRLTRVHWLVDGDLETAWNSRSGDLVGAWVEARIPDAATVEAISLTVGCTRVRGEDDLFTGNHRITRVRVRHAGELVGEFDLDPEVRELQSIPIGRSGGTYRLEVLELRRGSQRSWREACISELRVMGRAPDQQPGTRFPHFAIGALPDLPTPPSPEAAHAALTEAVQRVATEWRALVSIQGERHRVCGLEAQEERDAGPYRMRRRRFLLALASLVEPIDAPRGDALRVAAYALGYDVWEFLDPTDHDRVVEAMQAVLEAAGDSALRCRWDDANAGIQLRRASDAVQAAQHACAHLEQFYYPRSTPREEVRQCRSVERALPRFEALGAMSGSLRRRADRLRGYSHPAALTGAVSGLAARWQAMRTALDAATQSCGWE